MLILAGPLLQGPARGGGRSRADRAEARYQEREQASDGDTSEYSGSSSEEGDAPVSGGAAGGADGGGPGGQQEIGGGGGFWQNDNGGMDIGGRATSTPADGPGRQQEIGGSGGFRQNSDDGMDVGGRSTSTPAAETGEQDFDPRRADGGGAAEEMDRNGAVGLTSYQKRHAQRQRAKQRAQAPD